MAEVQAQLKHHDKSPLTMNNTILNFIMADKQEFLNAYSTEKEMSHTQEAGNKASIQPYCRQRAS